MEHRAAALAQRNAELQAELEATREALRQALTARRGSGGPNKLPVLRQPPPQAGQPGQAVVVWRRGR